MKQIKRERKYLPKKRAYYKALKKAYNKKARQAFKAGMSWDEVKKIISQSIWWAL